jgi:hypothetical protein
MLPMVIFAAINAKENLSLVPSLRRAGRDRHIEKERSNHAFIAVSPCTSEVQADIEIACR